MTDERRHAELLSAASAASSAWAGIYPEATLRLGNHDGFAYLAGSMGQLERAVRNAVVAERLKGVRSTNATQD